LLCKDQPDLWQSYRDYGNSQAKLSFLKIDELEKKPNFVDIKTLEALANEDMWMELQSIEIGQWAKSDLRTMSISAGVKDAYDTYYSWISAFSHSQWSPVRDSIFQTCLNPLHRLHRIPLQAPRQHPSVLSDAYSLISKILELIDGAYSEAEFKKVDIDILDQNNAEDE